MTRPTLLTLALLGEPDAHGLCMDYGPRRETGCRIAEVRLLARGEPASAPALQELRHEHGKEGGNGEGEQQPCGGDGERLHHSFTRRTNGARLNASRIRCLSAPASAAISSISPGDNSVVY